MIFETRYGTLDLPYDNCIQCIATGFYTACSYCYYRWGLVEDALPLARKRDEELQRWIDEHPDSVTSPADETEE